MSGHWSIRLPRRVADAEAEDDPVAGLGTRLHAQRRQIAVEASHEIAVRRDQLTRRAELSLIDDEEADFAAEMRRRAADRVARVGLETLRRRTASGGHRARTRAMVLRSAEYRAVRVDTVRRAALRVGGAALLVMALWSTAGVHAGVVTLLGLPARTLGWWAAWAVEPALMGIVALIIISRSMLRSAGGALTVAAGWVEVGALTTSILLNAAGGAVHAEGWRLIAAMAAHSIGPVGAAAIACLIGVIDASCASADPWTGAPTMADLGLVDQPGIIDDTPIVEVEDADPWEHSWPVLAAGTSADQEESIPAAESITAVAGRTQPLRLVSARSEHEPSERASTSPASEHERTSTSTSGMPDDARQWITARLLAGHPPTGTEISDHWHVHATTGRRWLRILRTQSEHETREASA